MTATKKISTNQAQPSHFQAYQWQFANYLRDPLRNEPFPATLPVGIGVYATLLHNKIDGSLRHCFPITHDLLGPSLWRQLVEAFIRSHRCQSPLYREIPDEFVDFLVNGKAEPELPEFIIELAHYEWMELLLETTPEDQMPPLIAMTDPLEQVPILNPVLHLLYYHYPVHRINAITSPWSSWQRQRKPYPRETVILIGLRDPELNPQFIEVNAATARLIELLKQQILSGRKALTLLQNDINQHDRDSLLTHGADTLKRLHNQNIIVGALNV
ncbi:putative DNA-binding domain-containing protein [Methylomarinum sp. Ch1-1]|uniref:DNA-binding domain-containing protein n=1 Tax=Methylomarinum roseum TaxID=3067653 RepID=A0AAU7NQR4_9GAMM|nr:putative DNA-binding domain-containing protein [Methylomarinum sp. Ch1-1]MDP4520698.1 putative DNA-binding domain-containing protein [Methylomarinum sp. Ch1-1]